MIWGVIVQTFVDRLRRSADQKARGRSTGRYSNIDARGGQNQPTSEVVYTTTDANRPLTLAPAFRIGGDVMKGRRSACCLEYCAGRGLRCKP
jgi:hypothetical protein